MTIKQIKPTRVRSRVVSATSTDLLENDPVAIYWGRDETDAPYYYAGVVKKVYSDVIQVELNDGSIEDIPQEEWNLLILLSKPVTTESALSKSDVAKVAVPKKKINEEATRYKTKHVRNPQTKVFESVVIDTTTGEQGLDYVGYATDGFGDKQYVMFIDGKLLTVGEGNPDFYKPAAAKKQMQQDYDKNKKFLDTIRKSHDTTDVDYRISNCGANFCELVPKKVGTTFSESDLTQIHDWVYPFGGEAFFGDKTKTGGFGKIKVNFSAYIFTDEVVQEFKRKFS